MNYFYTNHDQYSICSTLHTLSYYQKKDEAVVIGDYRPISLSHSFTKLISKLMSVRLADELNQLVSRAQSAFIKRRSIHDNFLYTQNLIRELHRAKKPTFFSEDIAKAFDTVKWDCLQEVLEQFGFGNRWRTWVTILLGKSTSSVLLNGFRGKWFKHTNGLRQGDPLSPMLFILAMEPLHLMLQKATEQGLLSSLGSSRAKLRVNFYADDAAIFVNPISEEVNVVKTILNGFGEASGLLTNIDKSAVYPISCEGLDLQLIMQSFQCPIKAFPCKYLGLSLSLRQLKRVEVQPLIDKIGKKLAVWKGRLLNKSGRLKLVNSMLSTMPTYFLTVFKLPKWAIKSIDKFRRGFLWKGTTDYKGGQCLVNWPAVKRPKKFGGLGILDLDLFSRALRLRWLWFQWTEPDRPWVGTEPPIDPIDRQLFRVSTTVTIGDGQKKSFWQSSWLHGKAPMDVYPDLFRLAWRKNRSVKDELQNQSWTRGLWCMQTVSEMAQFVELWDQVQTIQLTNSDDQIT